MRFFQTLRHITVSAWVYAMIALLAVLYAIYPINWLRLISSSLVVLFLILECRATPKPQISMAIGLTVAGALSAFVSGNVIEVLLDGISRAQIFLTLFFAVSWLQFVSVRSPTLKAARALVIQQPPARRQLVLTFTVHLLGGVLNLAGFSLLASIVSNKLNSVTRKRFTLAIMQGFTSVTTWSPFMVSMPVVLFAVPGVSWSDIAAIGFLVAVIYMTAGWLVDRIFYYQPVDDLDQNAMTMPVKTKWRVAGILIALITLVMGFVEVSGLSIPVSLAITIPPFSLIWYWSMLRSQDKEVRIKEGMIYQVFAGFPNLRGEAWIFVGANIFGVGVASLISPEIVRGLLVNFSITAELALVLLPLTIVSFSVIGLHPVIPVILIGELLPPEVLGLRPWVMALMLVSAWGLSINVSPFSGVVLLMSRIATESNYTIAWRWCLPFVLASSGVMIVSILVINALASAG